MLEAKLQAAILLKRLLDSVRELVTDANFECTEEGINLQAMDNSHVALVAVNLEAGGFAKYRCDRPMPLGVNLNSLSKVLRCAKDDDICILKATDDADVLNLVYEAKNSDRIAEYDMKLMDIDSDTLGIPDTDYDARVTMPSTEFSRIVRDLSQLGESVRIEVSKEGVRFASDGEAANGSVLLKQTEKKKSVKQEKEAGSEDEGEGSGQAKAVEDGDEGEEDDDEIKEIKKEKIENGDDVEMDGDATQEDDNEEFKAKSDDEGEEEQDDESNSKKRKRAPTKNGKAPKKAKKEEESEGGVKVEMNQHVNLTFSLKYLVNFSKSSTLSSRVQLMMSNEVPLLVSYKFEQGYIRYYLAPKIGDD